MVLRYGRPVPGGDAGGSSTRFGRVVTGRSCKNPGCRTEVVERLSLLLCCVAQGAIYRRPANTHQRAIIAAKIANAVVGGRRMIVPGGTIILDEAAQKANVSPRGKLRERGPWPFAAPRN